MAIVYKVLAQTQVGVVSGSATTSTVYTVPAGKQAVISSINVYNPDTVCYGYTGNTYGIYALKSGGTIGNSTALVLSNAVVPPGETVSYQLGVTLGAGESLGFSSNLGQYNVEVSGGEIT